MEAQQVITMSINKITGSRGQRGGINLRKNLLVATVLHSARAIYYEEMCNRMARHSAESEPNSRERKMSVDEDDDCTEAPDWGDDSSTRPSCERVENHDSQQEQQQPIEDKENIQPSVTKPLSVQSKRAETATEADRVTEERSESPWSTDKDRMVLGQKNTNSPVPVQSGCNACKRKRSDSSEELRDACESILPKRAKSSDSDCQTEDNNSTSARRNSDGSITSLVTIFKSGFHGLSGDSNAKTSNIVSGPSNTSNHLQQSSYASSMPRPFEQLPMPIAAC